MILDTSYLIDLIQRQQSAFEKGSSCSSRGPFAASRYRFCLNSGREFVNDEDRRRRVRNARMGYPIVPLDESMSRRAAKLLAAADRAENGSSGIEANDAYVGTAADLLDEPVLSDKIADFETLGVSVETY